MGALTTPPVPVIELVRIRSEDDVEVLATLAEGSGATFEAFTLAQHGTDVHVFDILRSRRGLIPVDGSVRWIPLGSVVERLLPVEELRELEAALGQFSSRAQSVGISGNLPPTPRSRPALIKVLFVDSGFFAVAEADRESSSALDYYCLGNYQGTVLSGANSIRFAEPYIVVVDRPDATDGRTRLRVFNALTIAPACEAP